MSTYSRVRASGLREPHAVPALGDLRAGDAEAEPEPAVGQRVQRRGRHRRHRGRPGRDLQHRAADVDRVRVRGDPGQHGDRVRAVGLGRPDHGEAEPFGLADEREVVGCCCRAGPSSRRSVPDAPANLSDRPAASPGRRAGSVRERETAHGRPQRTEGLASRPRHDDVGRRDRRGRGGRPAGGLPRRRRDARRHRGVLRLRRVRDDPRRPRSPTSSRASISSSPPRPASSAPTRAGRSTRPAGALLRRLDESLRKLGTDYIDLWYVHYIDDTVPFEETLGALDHAVTSGQGALRRRLELLRLADRPGRRVAGGGARAGADRREPGAATR